MGSIFTRLFRIARLFSIKGVTKASKWFRANPIKAFIVSIGIDQAINYAIDAISDEADAKEQSVKDAFNSIFLPGNDLMNYLIGGRITELNVVMVTLSSKYYRLSAAKMDVQLYMEHVLNVQEYLHKTNGLSYLLRQKDELLALYEYISGVPFGSVDDEEADVQFLILADYAFMTMTKAGASGLVSEDDLKEAIEGIVAANSDMTASAYSKEQKDAYDNAYMSSVRQGGPKGIATNLSATFKQALSRSQSATV